MMSKYPPALPGDTYCNGCDHLRLTPAAGEVACLDTTKVLASGGFGGRGPTTGHGPLAAVDRRRRTTGIAALQTHEEIRDGRVKTERSRVPPLGERELPSRNCPPPSSDPVVEED